MLSHRMQTPRQLWGCLLLVTMATTYAASSKEQAEKIKTLQNEIKTMQTENQRLRGMQTVVSQLQEQIKLMQLEGTNVGAESNELLEKDNEIAQLVSQLQAVSQENDKHKSQLEKLTKELRTKSATGDTIEQSSTSTTSTCTKEKSTIKNLQQENSDLRKEVKSVNDLNIQWQDKSERSDKFVLEMASNLTRCQMEAIGKATDVRVQYEDRLKNANKLAEDCKSENKQLYKDLSNVEKESYKQKKRVDDLNEQLEEMTKLRNEALLLNPRDPQDRDDIQYDKEIEKLTAEKRKIVEELWKEREEFTKYKADAGNAVAIKQKLESLEGVGDLHQACIASLETERNKLRVEQQRSFICESNEQTYKFYFFIALGCLVVAITQQIVSTVLRSNKPKLTIKDLGIQQEIQKRKQEKETLNKKSNSKKRR
ncbi:unnamed protein product [Owenia fusiformis]|uniref:Uncharacterized protein n=1 Tax=Owenia fusiformis TaxID=6347 RepID=A0A8S4Q7F6_OWEFU|nr:unnamed protein product [Owenia fusiformis]